MSNFISSGQLQFFAGTITVPENTAGNRGKFVNANGHAFALARETSDPLGTASLTITGAKDGTEIHVFSTTGERLAGAESAAASETFTLPRFASGDPRNVVRVLVASLQFENIDVDVTIGTTPTTIPIFQRRDRTYRNPT